MLLYWRGMNLNMKLKAFTPIKVGDMPKLPTGTLPPFEILQVIEPVAAKLARGDEPTEVLQQFSNFLKGANGLRGKRTSGLTTRIRTRQYEAPFIKLSEVLNTLLACPNLQELPDDALANLDFLCSWCVWIPMMSHFNSMDFEMMERFKTKPAFVDALRKAAILTNQFIDQMGAQEILIPDYNTSRDDTGETYLLTDDCLYLYRPMAVDPNANHIRHMLVLSKLGQDEGKSWVRQKVGFWNPIKGVAYEFDLNMLSDEDRANLQLDIEDLMGR